MMKYLTRAKKVQPDLPDVFSASKAPIPAKTQEVEEIEAVNRFMKDNPRTDMAGGGTIAGGNIQGQQIGDRTGFANLCFYQLKMNMLLKEETAML